MPLKKIRKILDNIDKQRPVNINELDKAISQLHLKHNYNLLRDIQFYRPNNKGNRYIVININKDLVGELRALIENVGTDRETASLHGKSHTFKVDGSLLVCREEGGHPTTITFNTKSEFTKTQPIKKYLLIIENLQLFLKDTQTLEFLIAHCGFKGEYRSSLDIVWGDGNLISNSYHRIFFNQYQHIFCLFDIDLGGLKIANNLLNMDTSSDFIFLYPKQIEQRLDLVPIKQSERVINETLKLCANQPKLQPICEIIRKTSKFIEQEDYLQWKI